MVAPAISHLICTTALIGLIFALPFFYSMVTENVRANMTIRELKEIADYISSTFGNLYYLVNSSDYNSVKMEKELIFLPTYVENSAYIVKIEDIGGNVTFMSAYLTERPSINGSAWIAPGIKMGLQIGQQNWIQSGRNVVAACGRDSTAISIWFRYK